MYISCFCFVWRVNLEVDMFDLCGVLLCSWKCVYVDVVRLQVNVEDVFHDRKNTILCEGWFILVGIWKLFLCHFEDVSLISRWFFYLHIISHFIVSSYRTSSCFEACVFICIFHVSCEPNYFPTSLGPLVAESFHPTFSTLVIDFTRLSPGVSGT